MQRNPKSTSDSTDSNSPNSQPKLVKASDLPPELAERTDYIDVKELGQGGMGMVYLATNKMLARQEVLKVVGRQHLSRAGAKDRFLQEIQSAARLQHPNVVMAYAAIQANESIIFAMEYAPGTDLQKHVKANGPLSVQMACHHAAHTALGLQHAHEKKMVHRDIKPANLMLTRDGKKPVVKILDFGLAKITSEQDHNVATDDDGSQPQDTGLTRQGQMMGTPDYVAPEQILDAAKADIRADIYSLGCTLYFLLTGKPPFRATKLAELLSKHLRDMPTPLNEIRPDVPKELADIVLKMMAKKPAERYQSPAEVANALKPYLKPPGAKANTADTMVINPATSGEKNSGTIAPQAWDTMLVDSDNDTVDEIKTKRQGTQSGQPPWLWIAMGGGLAIILLLSVTLVFVLKSKDTPSKPEVAEKPTTSPKPIREETKTPKTPKDIEPKPLQPLPPQVKPPEISPPPELNPNPNDPKPGQERVVDIGNGLKMTFCWIPRGKATLGSPLSETQRQANEAAHRFETNGFWFGKYEVTQAVYLSVMGENPSRFRGPRLPVDMVSWYDCKQFVMKCALNGIQVRLPTEDEWEYASRGGRPISSTYYWGSSLNGNEANCDGKRPYETSSPTGLMQGPSLGKTTEVGHFEQSNRHPWNLCDVIGNVWEWCDKFTNSEFIPRTIRGGSWISSADSCRTARRNHWMPDSRMHDFGFRLIYIPDEPDSPEKNQNIKPKKKPNPERLATVVNMDTWEIDQDILKMKRPSDWINMIIFGNDTWRNYEFSFKVLKLGDNPYPNGVAGLFRCTSIGTRGEFFCGHDRGEHSDLQWFAEHRFINLPQIPEMPTRKIIPSFAAKQWYEYVITVNNDQVITKFDGKEIHRYKDSISRSGKVGFHTSPGMFHFKDIKVTAPDGKILWEGLPELP